jgi:hypothetical protein
MPAGGARIEECWSPLIDLTSRAARFRSKSPPAAVDQLLGSDPLTCQQLAATYDHSPPSSPKGPKGGPTAAHLPPLQLRVLEQGTKKQGVEAGSVTDLGGIEVEKSLIGGFLP